MSVMLLLNLWLIPSLTAIWELWLPGSAQLWFKPMQDWRQ